MPLYRVRYTGTRRILSGEAAIWAETLEAAEQLFHRSYDVFMYPDNEATWVIDHTIVRTEHVRDEPEPHTWAEPGQDGPQPPHRLVDRMFGR